jgi:hypothetical protein
MWANGSAGGSRVVPVIWQGYSMSHLGCAVLRIALKTHNVTYVVVCEVRTAPKAPREQQVWFPRRSANKLMLNPSP